MARLSVRVCTRAYVMSIYVSSITLSSTYQDPLFEQKFRSTALSKFLLYPTLARRGLFFHTDHGYTGAVGRHRRAALLHDLVPWPCVLSYVKVTFLVATVIKFVTLTKYRAEATGDSAPTSLENGRWPILYPGHAKRELKARPHGSLWPEAFSRGIFAAGRSET